MPENVPKPSIETADDSTRLPYDQVLVDITEYVFHYEVPPESKAWARAKLALFDALGCVFETLRESPEARAIIGPVVPGSLVPEGFKLPGTSFQLDPVKGAFDLGSLIRYLDHNDAFPGAEWGHPSDNIGAIFAVVDWLSRTASTNGWPPLTMKTVLLAIVKTYEIQGCFQIRNAFNKMGLDHTILVRIASTAVTCHLMGCTKSQTLAGVSHAFVDAGPLRIYRQSPNAGPRKGWAAGDACMRAVHLALLAKKGQPGVPTVLSDPKWGLYTVVNKGKEFELPKPFGNWVVETTFFKIHAAEGHAASAVEAALILSQQLRARNPRDVWPIEEKISHIRVRTQRPAMIIINKQGTLHNAADRDHCMQYMVAVVILKGSMISAADYGDDSPWATDPRVEILRAKIEMVEDPQFTLDYHNEKKRSGANALLLTLADGTKTEEVLVEYPTGHPWRNDTSDFVKDKFKTNVNAWFTDEKAESIVVLAETELQAFMRMEVSSFVDAFADGGDNIVSLVNTQADGQAETAAFESLNEDATAADVVDDASLKASSSGSGGRNMALPNGNNAVQPPVTNGKVRFHEAAKNGSEPHVMETANGEKEQQSAAPLARDSMAVAAMAVAGSTLDAVGRLVAMHEQTITAVKDSLETKPSHDGRTANGEVAAPESGSTSMIQAWNRSGKSKEQGSDWDGETYFSAFAPGKSPHRSPHVSFGLPFYRACAKHVAETFHATRVYILVSASLSSRTDDLPRLHFALDDKLGEDTVVGIRRGVKPHTYYSDILKIVKEAKDVNINCLVTLGGGSLTDTAKVVALALANDATTFNELQTLYFDSPTIRSPLLPATIPIICIPSTLSAGEYTPIAGATNDATHHKHSFQELSIGPRLIILDPSLTTTTPLHVWLSTGIRAVDHCVESLCSIKGSTEDDVIAEKALRRLVPGLLTMKEHPRDLEARLACQLGAMEAISAPLNMVPMGASHGIGHQLGPLGVGHGETSCILLPAVCKYNKSVNAEQQQRVLDILWSEDTVVNLLGRIGVEMGTADLGDILAAIIKELGMPRNLNEVGVGREKFAGLAVSSLKDRWCKTNPTPLRGPEQVVEILEMCLDNPPI